MSEETYQELNFIINHEEIVSAELTREEIIEIYQEIERLKTELQDTKEHLGGYLHEQEEENKRLNNIINKALEKSKGLQYRYGYVLDDLVYLLMQGSDKE